MNKSDSRKNASTQQARRRTLKTAMLGGAAMIAAPEKWARPIVNSVLLPAHAATTDDSGALTTGVTTTTAPQAKYWLSDNDLPAEREAQIEEGASEQTGLDDPGRGSLQTALADMLIPRAHATLSLNANTRYYLANISGNSYQCTITRTYAKTGNNYFAAGNLTLGEIIPLPTYKNCGNERLYKKHVKLVSVSPTEAVLEISILGYVFATKTLPYNAGAAPSTCSTNS